MRGIISQDEVAIWDERLLDSIRESLPELRVLLGDMEAVLETEVYRYYHGSMKVFGYQEYTERALVIFLADC